MNTSATILNKAIHSTHPNLYHLFSEIGKGLSPDKGILAQGAEAKDKAHRHNVTIGIATKDNTPMYLPGLYEELHTLNESEIFPYASSIGLNELRHAWQKRLLEVNPLLKNAVHSLPIVSVGLTHGLSVIGELFFDKGETLLISEQMWGNYKLIFSLRRQSTIKTFGFYEKDHFNMSGFEEAISEQARQNGKIKILLNLPNNPTGYQLSHEEALKIKDILYQKAETGISILLILDDAYVGLVYEESAYKESLFSLTCNLHENLLAVKICGISKELFAWGLRIGFITYGTKTTSTSQNNVPLYHALETKTTNLIRGSVSSVSLPIQSAVKRFLEKDHYKNECKQNLHVLKQRYQKVKRVLQNKAYTDTFHAYPFNSGYFMLLHLHHGLNADAVRLTLLNKEGIGTVTTGKHDLRIAFSCIEEKNIQDLFDRIYKVCKTIVS